jgi:hypothetical protein
MLYYLPGIKGHGKAFPAPLRVPDNAHSLVPFGRCSLNRAVNSLIHRVELVISGDFLNDLRAIDFKHNEILKKVEKSPPVEYAFNQYLKLRESLWSQIIS